MPKYHYRVVVPLVLEITFEHVPSVAEMNTALYVEKHKGNGYLRMGRKVVEQEELSFPELGVAK